MDSEARRPDRPGEATRLIGVSALHHDSNYDCYWIADLFDFHEYRISCNHWPLRRNITINNQWIS